VWELPEHATDHPITLTFDDGGSSAAAIAGILQRFGWIGHFFITTDYIGRSSFLTRSQIREIRKNGHLIGSHSCSHPDGMADLDFERTCEEWRRSVETLSDILGEKMEMASVPGGSYSRKVAAAASRAGVKALFTSEPTLECRQVHGCLVLGRFYLLRGMPASTAAGIYTGSGYEREKRYLAWRFLRISRRVTGRFYRDIKMQLLKKM
jgi:peptidoglycan/xylan/chitin deacetylase (PgdA/CDA1 family)